MWNFFSAVVVYMNFFGTSMLAGYFWFKITHPPQKSNGSPLTYQKLTTGAKPGEVGGAPNRVYMARHHPDIQVLTLSLLYTIFFGKGNPFIYLP